MASTGALLGEGADAPLEECSAICNLVIARAEPAQHVRSERSEVRQFRRRGVGPLLPLAREQEADEAPVGAEGEASGQRAGKWGDQGRV